TDGEGHLVLGSGKGVLRLYDGKGKNDNNYKRAKTQLNAYRDPIKHVAVTKDGSWILEEQHIVTSTNNLVIIWDFVAVKNGKTDAYQIRRISDYIKDLTFMQMGEKEAVLMVTPSSITTRGVRRAYKDCESGDEA
ncbi:hypothetical protein EMWEY_00051550, partial [Eimeria maxima]